MKKIIAIFSVGALLLVAAPVLAASASQFKAVGSARPIITASGVKRLVKKKIIKKKMVIKKITPHKNTAAPISSVAPLPAAPEPAPENFSVKADDNSANPAAIRVKKGDHVSITFIVAADEVYHGGLDFRSPTVSTGTIAPGSAKTVNFTADTSFVFTPFWPSSNIQKSYTITVTVQ